MTEDMKRGKTEDRKGDREGNKAEDRTEDIGRRKYTTIPLHHYTTNTLQRTGWRT